MTNQQPQDARTGVINALCAYFMWGFAPLYFKLLSDVASEEILIHRIVWSAVILLVMIVLMRKGKDFVAVLKDKPKLTKLIITALLIGSNWFVYIWAVNNGQILDASLGYYINPLLNVALGIVFLGERLRKWQGVAVGLAIVGVLIQVIVLGSLPIISLVLACTFGIYGLLRKKLFIDSFVGLLVETLVLLPMALIYWAMFANSDTSNLLTNSMDLNLLLLMAGIVTIAPLLCFNTAAKNLALATLGFFQYIGPSIMFLLATFHYNEPLVPAKLATFAFIWLALIIYSYDSYRVHRKKVAAKA